MLKYLIIPLADNSVSFCHYEQAKSTGRLVPPGTLKDAIFWAMKQNLAIQFIYPDSKLPEDYGRIINSIDHTSIVGATCADAEILGQADIVVMEDWEALNTFNFRTGASYILKTSKADLFSNAGFLPELFPKVDRLVVVVTDIDKFSQEDFDRYGAMLESFIPPVTEEYRKGHPIQLNLLTDRIMLDGMNNCNAGWESITLAPDGKFYICPAFYLDGGESTGDLSNGPDIPNSQLYRIDHAPICRNCDAWQCRRCVWLNRKTTREVNTPSHEQCVVAHLERNASRKLLQNIRRFGGFMPDKEIPVVDYLDPFDIFNK